VSPAKTAEPIEMLFGLWTQDGPKEPCIRWGSWSPNAQGQFWGGKARPIVKYRHLLCCAKTAEPIAMQLWTWDSGGPELACSRRGCTLPPPAEYDWTVHVRRQCTSLSNYFGPPVENSYHSAVDRGAGRSTVKKNLRIWNTAGMIWEQQMRTGSN